MSTRVILSNLAKVALLLPILFGAPKAVQLVCLLGIAASLIVDIVLYRRDQRVLGANEHEDESRHVPLPSDRS